jgi:uncharacterized protein (DUF2344 family)|tara:strand:+ start:1295 stop:1504 length:210 start_codon:yes stop_codon:yes gene_type:complete
MPKGIKYSKGPLYYVDNVSSGKTVNYGGSTTTKDERTRQLKEEREMKRKILAKRGILWDPKTGKSKKAR